VHDEALGILCPTQTMAASLCYRTASALAALVYNRLQKRLWFEDAQVPADPGTDHSEGRMGVSNLQASAGSGPFKVATALCTCGQKFEFCRQQQVQFCQPEEGSGRSWRALAIGREAACSFEVHLL
jgi:hypothetical protein